MSAMSPFVLTFAALCLLIASGAQAQWQFENNSDPDCDGDLCAKGQTDFSMEAIAYPCGPQPPNQPTAQCLKLSGWAKAQYGVGPLIICTTPPCIGTMDTPDGDLGATLDHMDDPADCSWSFPNAGCQVVHGEDGNPIHYHWHSPSAVKVCHPGEANAFYSVTSNSALGTYEACYWVN